MTKRKMAQTYYYTKGKAWWARNARDLVRQMHCDAPLCQETNDETFMLKCAARVELFDGANIRWDTAENFVQDLLNIGLLHKGETVIDHD